MTPPPRRPWRSRVTAHRVVDPDDHRPGRAPGSPRTTATGQCPWVTRAIAVEPARIPGRPPSPTDPTTTSRAAPDTSTRLATGAPAARSSSTARSGRPSTTAFRASPRRRRPSDSRAAENSAGSSAAQWAIAGWDTACTNRSGRSPWQASSAAHRAAATATIGRGVPVPVRCAISSPGVQGNGRHPATCSQPSPRSRPPPWPEVTDSQDLCQSGGGARAAGWVTPVSRQCGREGRRPPRISGLVRERGQHASVGMDALQRTRPHAGHRRPERRHHASPERRGLAILRVERTPRHRMVLPARSATRGRVPRGPRS